MDINKLREQLDSLSNSPIIKAIKDFENSANKILNITKISTLGQEAIKLQKSMNNDYFKSIFKSQEEYKKLMNSINDALSIKDLSKLKKVIPLNYEKIIQPSYMDSINKYKKIYNVLNTANLEKICGIDIKELNSQISSLNTDLFKSSLDVLNKERENITNVIPVKNKSTKIKFLKNPIFDVIEQNEKIIKHLDLIGKTLNQTSSYIQTQNLLTQQQIDENRKSSRQAFWVAIISIFIAIAVALLNIWLSKTSAIEINQHHKELLNALDSSSILKQQNEQSKILEVIMYEIKSQNKARSEQANKQNNDTK